MGSWLKSNLLQFLCLFHFHSYLFFLSTQAAGLNVLIVWLFFYECLHCCCLFIFWLLFPSHSNIRMGGEDSCSYNYNGGDVVTEVILNKRNLSTVLLCLLQFNFSSLLFSSLLFSSLLFSSLLFSSLLFSSGLLHIYFVLFYSVCFALLCFSSVLFQWFHFISILFCLTLCLVTRFCFCSSLLFCWLLLSSFNFLFCTLQFCTLLLHYFSLLLFVTSLFVRSFTCTFLFSSGHHF